ncbi:transposase [Streptomyces ehimensis]|uniref:Transposase n=1 Tax=Streptomyces ehimensis TaxID=68195 RepID=A0ABV9BV11_9ACTN
MRAALGQTALVPTGLRRSRRLFLLREWETDSGRRTATRVPSEPKRREKFWLTGDMLDILAGWGMRPPVVVADAAYGTNAYLRTAW